MSAIYVVHWSTAELPAYARAVHELGYADVRGHAEDAAAISGKAGAEQPVLVVTWLSRAPEKGRALGLALKANEATAQIPLLFVDGGLSAVADTRSALPHAHFTTSMLLPGELVRLLGRE